MGVKMTSEEAISYFKEITDRADDEYDELVDASFRAIEALKAQEWIPCSERLPEEGVEVLVSDGDDVWEDTLHTYKNFYGTNIYRWRIFGEIDDTAWMPLPEPYKAKSEDKE